MTRCKPAVIEKRFKLSQENSGIDDDIFGKFPLFSSFVSRIERTLETIETHLKLRVRKRKPADRVEKKKGRALILVTRSRLKTG